MSQDVMTRNERAILELLEARGPMALGDLSTHARRSWQGCLASAGGLQLKDFARKTEVSGRLGYEITALGSAALAGLRARERQ